MAIDTTAGRIENGNITLKDIIMPCAASITAASFLAKTMEMTPLMGTILYWLACAVIVMSFLALISMVLKYFANPRTARV